MTIQKLARQGVSAVALGALLALQPATFGVTIGGFGVAKAFAKDGGGGNDSSGGGSSGSGSGGSGSGGSGSGSGSGSGGSGGGQNSSDDSGGSGGSGGSDDSGGGSGRSGGDDNGGGSGRSGGSDDGGSDGGDDRAGDDHRGGAGDQGSVATGGGSAAGLRVVSFERTGAGVEVVYSNGVKEEIENGRLEMKDAAGRTVVERPATQRDVARLNGNLRNSGIAPAPAGSQATRVEVSGGAIEVTYATGWREELAGGRYELKDPNNNTVVQRSATAADVQRLRALAGS